MMVAATSRWTVSFRMSWRAPGNSARRPGFSRAAHSAAGARSLTAVLPPAWDELASDFGQVMLPVLLGRRKREQLPVLVPAVNPVLTPVAPVDNELEIAAGQRMEPVSYPDTPVPIIWIGCSQRRRPTPTQNGS